MIIISHDGIQVGLRSKEIVGFTGMEEGQVLQNWLKGRDESGILEVEKASGILKYPVNFANREYAWNRRKPKGAMI